MECHNMPDGWNDKAHSWSMRKFEDIGGANVYWNYFPATEGV